ncbi:hypothetical protein [Amycolatopsis acidicola]|nr:hypothetical protein [Amycolatopsis acidicola]
MRRRGCAAGAAGVRPVRGRHVLLIPEGVSLLNETAAAVVS